MLVAIIGGNLQGVEATYLAKKAGWEVLLIDKDPQAAASLMCDRFLPMMITGKDDPSRILEHVDLMVPALEDNGVLSVLTQWSSETGIPLAFDIEAYAISSSKTGSNQLFREVDIPTPRLWPDCAFPIVVKPDRESGSRGVKCIHSEQELASSFPEENALNRMVAQEWLDGPSYSIEIIGFPGNYAPLQVTELQMDGGYDCKRVLAPSGLDPALVTEFEQMAVRVAERIQLKGLMDLEVILHDGDLKMLEIDARLPSQTPTTVFQSTGVNMIELLGDLFLTGKMDIRNANRPRAVIYEHVKVKEDRIEVLGEHIMGGIGPVRLYQGLFGADEAITNLQPELSEWVATLILTGATMDEALAKKRKAYESIRGEARYIAHQLDVASG